MKSFLLSIIISSLVIGTAYSAQKKYWGCSFCHTIYGGYENPPLRPKCSGTKFQQTHNWVPMEITQINEKY